MNSGQDGNAFQQFGANNVGAGNGAGNGIDYGASYNPGAVLANSGFNTGVSPAGSGLNAGMAPVGSGQGFVSSDSGDIMLTATPRKGSKKGIIAAIVILFLLAASVAAGLWFMVGGGVVGGNGGTTTERFNRFANYLIYEEDSSEWGHGDEEFSSELVENFIDRFYSGGEEWNNYIKKSKKLYEEYAKSYNGDDEYINGMDSFVKNDLYGFDMIFEYIWNLGLFEDEVSDAYNNEGRSASTLVDEKYAPLISSNYSLAISIGENLKKREMDLIETYALGSPSSEMKDTDDGVGCYEYNGYGCLSYNRATELRYNFNSEVIMGEDVREDLINDGATELIYTTWRIAKVFMEGNSDDL